MEGPKCHPDARTIHWLSISVYPTSPCGRSRPRRPRRIARGGRGSCSLVAQRHGDDESRGACVSPRNDGCDHGTTNRPYGGYYYYYYESNHCGTDTTERNDNNNNNNRIETATSIARRGLDDETSSTTTTRGRFEKPTTTTDTTSQTTTTCSVRGNDDHDHPFAARGRLYGCSHCAP